MERCSAGECDWQPRYDCSAPTAEHIRALPALAETMFLAEDDITVLGLLRSFVYVRDICVRCGATVERSGPR